MSILNCTTTEGFAETRASSVCADESCPPYAKCNHTNTGNRCMCPNCSHSGRKVCGSDGKTYKDSCTLKKHSCKKKQHIKVTSHGACSGKVEEKRRRSHYKTSSQAFSKTSWRRFIHCYDPQEQLLLTIWFR